MSSILSKKNVKITLLSTIIPLGVWGGIELKKVSEQKSKENKSKPLNYENYSIEKIQKQRKELMNEKSKLEAEVLTIMAKKEKAELIYNQNLNRSKRTTNDQQN
ncbi:hypothetical protein BB558_006194 [Smittium angustum]|uniref:Uncharacterized protein n=1 Tax=Smittium angustum TaxID=133377 RepID=A0A2U1IYD8_SMIAN|nr:hypothetical protein BB558_006194 [Smittium angustum]